MRLTKNEITSIHNSAIKYFGENSKVFLFGSRIDDNKKGGDIDLYLETDLKDGVFNKKVEMLTYLNLRLGEQKIDLVINNFQRDKSIFQAAQQDGILL
jgi:uncharacterized protein